MFPGIGFPPVSYTHLDVYKRQFEDFSVEAHDNFIITIQAMDMRNMMLSALFALHPNNNAIEHG